jgi:hypothetical protein
MEFLKILHNLFYAKTDKEISGLKAEIEILKQTPIIPLEKGKITIQQVNEILKGAFPNAQIFLSDMEYSLTDVAEASSYTIKSLISTKKYVAETHDCDNFSFALCGYWSESLKSFSVGIIWTKEHAFNVGIFLDENGSNHLYIIEPQTNAFMELPEAQKNKMYQNVQVIMM